MVVFIDKRVPVNETVLQRGSGNVAGIGAGAKWLYNKVRGRGDQNAAGFRETTRNARYTGTIKAHAKAIRSLVGEINRFIAQQSAEGKDTSELEKITNGINDFFARNEKVFGFGVGEADAEDYKNTEVEPPKEAEPKKGGGGILGLFRGRGGKAAGSENAGNAPGSNGGAAEEPAGVDGDGAAAEEQEVSSNPQGQPKQVPNAGAETGQPETGPAEGEDVADAGQQRGAPETESPAGASLGAGPSATSGAGRRQATPQRPAPPPKKRGWWADGQASVPNGAPAKKRGWWMDESAVLNALYGTVCLDEGVSDVRTDVGMLYNTLLMEAQTPVNTQAGQADQQQMNDVAAKVFSQLGDMADKGTDEDKDFVYQLIQKLASGKYTMQNAMQDIAARAQQAKAAGGQQGQQGQQVTEGFDDMRRRFYARQAGKQAARAGGDRKAAEQEAYGNRIHEFQTRLDRELGELSLDLKTMGYKQQAGDADKLLKSFRQAVAQFSKSGKEEGETSWLQRRRHGLGHWAVTWATYRALNMLCPATILGSPYFRKAVMGAATSVIRDVSRDNLNKKSIMRALIGAGIAAGGSYVGDKIGSYIKGAMGGQGNAAGVANGGVDGNGVEATEYQGGAMPGFEDKIELPNGQTAVSTDLGDNVFAVKDPANGIVHFVDKSGNPVDEMNFDVDDLQYARDVADLELSEPSPGYFGQQGLGGTHLRGSAGTDTPKLPGTYEAGIRTSDANGNPISLSPEDTAKVNAVRNIRNYMAGGPMSGGESSKELMNLPKYTAPKLRVVQYRGDEISRDMIGRRAWAAARDITKNGNGSGILSGVADSDGEAASYYIANLAKVDRPLASWFENHPDDFNALAKYVGDSDNVDIDKGQFSALVRKVGSVKEALRQLGRRMTPEEIADRAKRWEEAQRNGCDF